MTSSFSPQNRSVVIIPYLWDYDRLRVVIMSSQQNPSWHFFTVTDNDSCDASYLSKKLKHEAGLLGVFEPEPFVSYRSPGVFKESRVYAFEVTELLDECLNAPVNLKMMILDVDVIHEHIDEINYFNQFEKYINGKKNVVSAACDEHVVIPYVCDDESTNIILNDDGVSNALFLSVKSARNIHANSDEITFYLTKKIRERLGLCGYIRLNPIDYYRPFYHSNRRIYVYEMLVYDVLDGRRCAEKRWLEYIKFDDIKNYNFDMGMRKILDAHKPILQSIKLLYSR